MPELIQSDFEFTAFLAEQMVAYRSIKGRNALEKERRPVAKLSPVENAWRRMAVKNIQQQQNTNERHAA